eukprot:scaffold2660_cov257-Pinguiococcus_pyrenoidosus.AAC.7
MGRVPKVALPEQSFFQRKSGEVPAKLREGREARGGAAATPGLCRGRSEAQRPGTPAVADAGGRAHARAHASAGAHGDGALLRTLQELYGRRLKRILTHRCAPMILQLAKEQMERRSQRPLRSRRQRGTAQAVHEHEKKIVAERHEMEKQKRRGRQSAVRFAPGPHENDAKATRSCSVDADAREQGLQNKAKDAAKKNKEEKTLRLLGALLWRSIREREEQFEEVPDVREDDLSKCFKLLFATTEQEKEVAKGELEQSFASKEELRDVIKAFQWTLAACEFLLFESDRGSNKASFEGEQISFRPRSFYGYQLWRSRRPTARAKRLVPRSAEEAIVLERLLTSRKALEKQRRSAEQVSTRFRNRLHHRTWRP